MHSRNRAVKTKKQLSVQQKVPIPNLRPTITPPPPPHTHKIARILIVPQNSQFWKWPQKYLQMTNTQINTSPPPPTQPPWKIVKFKIVIAYVACNIQSTTSPSAPIPSLGVMRRIWKESITWSHHAYQPEQRFGKKAVINVLSGIKEVFFFLAMSPGVPQMGSTYLNLLESPELLQILTLTVVIKPVLPNFLGKAIIILNFARRFRNFIANTVPW